MTLWWQHGSGRVTHMASRSRYSPNRRAVARRGRGAWGHPRTNHWVRSQHNIAVAANATQAYNLTPDTDVDQGTVASSTLIRVRGMITVRTPPDPDPLLGALLLAGMVITPADAGDVLPGADRSDVDWFAYEYVPCARAQVIIDNPGPPVSTVLILSWIFDWKAKRRVSTPLGTPHMFLQNLGLAAGNLTGTVFASTLIRSA